MAPVICLASDDELRLRPWERRGECGTPTFHERNKTSYCTLQTPGLSELSRLFSKHSTSDFRLQHIRIIRSLAFLSFYLSACHAFSLTSLIRLKFELQQLLLLTKLSEISLQVADKSSRVESSRVYFIHLFAFYFVYSAFFTGSCILSLSLPLSCSIVFSICLRLHFSIGFHFSADFI